MAEEKFSDETLLARWISGELEDVEEGALRSRSDFGDYERIIAAMDKVSLPAYDVHQELGRLKAKLATSGQPDRRETSASSSPTGKGPVRRLYPWIAAAAVVGLLLTAWFLFPSQTQQYVSQAGAREFVELPEGSTVRLNAASELSFQNPEGQRRVALDGEAFFDVEKAEEPFTVRTSLGTVMVLGTAFNVYARAGTMEVGCTEGRVSVVFEGVPETYLLTPGKSVTYSVGQRPEARDTLSSNILDWIDGNSTFADRPLAEVLAELVRQYDLEMEFSDPSFRQERISVSFPNDNLPLALEVIFDPLTGITYDIEGRRVVVLPNE